MMDVYNLKSASTRGVAQVLLQLMQNSRMVAELRYGLRFGAKLTIPSPSSRPQNMFDMAGPMLRGAASSQPVAAAAASAVQAIGGVAVAGEVASAAASAARRSCSRRRALSQDSRRPEHLSIISNLDQIEDQKAEENKNTDSSKRWQWMLEMEDMRKKWKEIEKEKEKWKTYAEHMNAYMDQRVTECMQRMEREMENNAKIVRDEANEENRLLTIQVQTLMEMNKALRDKELQRQGNMWPIQDLVAAQLANQKTAASQSNRRIEYHILFEQAGIAQQDVAKYSDEQASLIIQACRSNVSRVLINGVSMSPTVAVKDLARAQLERVSKILGDGDGGTVNHGAKHVIGENDLEDVFKALSVGAALGGQGQSAPSAIAKLQRGNGGAIPPHQSGSRDSTPLRASEGCDGDQDDISLSMFSVIRRDHSDHNNHNNHNDHGDEPPDGNGNDNGPITNRQTDDSRHKDDCIEFRLVNSRNIEIIKFAEVWGAK